MNKTIIYTVYELKERLSPTGMPYIGSTYDLQQRAYSHKSKLKLSAKPDLVVLYTSNDADDAWEREQVIRVQNGWKRERSNPLLKAVRGGKIGGKSNAKNGTGFCNFESRSKAGKSNAENGTGFCNFESRSKAGKAAVLVGAQSKAGKAAVLVGAQSKGGKIGGKVGGKIIGSRPWINKDGVNKRVDYNELETYLNTGWSRGRTKKNKIK
jgi:hypothetical protein